MEANKKNIIPEKLRKKGTRFLKVRPKQKIPSEISWQKNNNYEHDDSRLLNHLKNDGNYGVLGGKNNLIILDFDDAQTQEAAISLLPHTFSVKTGSGLLYLYFHTNDTTSHTIINHKTKKTLVDIQGTGKQVIGPGSTHPNGKKYEIIKDEEIAVININLIKQIFFKICDFNNLPNKWRFEVEDTNNNTGGYTGDIVNQIKGKIDCKNLLSNKGYKVSQSMKCPLHNDKTASAGVFDNGKAFNCFSGCGGGDVIWLYQQINNCNFKTALSELAEQTGIIREQTKNTTDKGTIIITNDFTTCKEQVIKHIMLKEPRKITETIAQYIKANHYIKTTMHDKGEEVWFYKEGVYEPNGETIIQSTARKLLEEAYTSHLKNEIVGKVKADTFIKSIDFFDQQNNKPYMLPVKNGILNLLTRELNKFNPNNYYFNKINAEFTPGAEPPFFIEFLQQILGTRELTDTIQEWFGYCLTRHYKYEKSIMFYGPHGRNGKSKLLEVLQILLGPGNFSNVSLKAIENSNNKFVLGDLRNKFVNIAADISDEALNNEGNFKGLTGGDSFTVDQKFKNSITFKNYAKMLFSSNSLPIPKDTSDAFWSRWILVEFPNRFLPQKEINAMSDEEKTNVHLQNTDLMSDIANDDELSGILNWSLEGLERLEKQGDFSYKDTLQTVKMKWNMQSNNVLAFCDTYIEGDDYDGYITKREFKHLYTHWCKRHRLKPVSEKSIYKTVSGLGGMSERRFIDDDRVMVWSNISIKKSIVPGREYLK